jgi:hypothetical protein
MAFLWTRRGQTLVSLEPLYQVQDPQAGTDADFDAMLGQNIASPEISS